MSETGFTRPAYAYPDPDREYMNSAFIPGSEALYPMWQARAAAFRSALGRRAELDRPHGPKPRQRHDIFHPEGEARGTLVFIHGGYWLECDRSDWSHLAAGAVSRGWRVILPSYTLAPEARIGEMARELAALLRQITPEGPLVLSGHSAGGHLAARLAAADMALPITRVVPISPLAELAPLMGTKMNETLRIDAGEAARESPARLALRPGTVAHVWVGGEERPAFLWQARCLSEEWACPWTVEPGKHHFSVLDGLEAAESPLLSTLLG